jgi:flagellar motor switch protein FliN/FliY
MSEENETMETDETVTAATRDDASAADAGQKQAGGENYQPAEFDDKQRDPGTANRTGDTNLDVILDIPVTLSMEIGRTRVSIQDLLQLAKGSVVELDRMAGEPLDVLVNGTLVARGEVVVVNDKFGVRLNDVISPVDRVQTLS